MRTELNDMNLEPVNGGAWYHKLGNGIVNTLCIPVEAVCVGLTAVTESVVYVVCKDKKDMDSTVSAADTLVKTVKNLGGDPIENVRDLF